MGSFLDIITSPVASAIGSVVNGISNYFSTKETNRTNAGINQSNIEFNREEAQKSRDWSEKMWNQENDYNSPANQLKLLREAGLNPVNFETSISPAGSPPSGAQASAPSSIPMQSTNFGVINSLAASQAALANAQSQKISQEARHLKGLNDAYDESQSTGFYWVNPDSGNIEKFDSGERRTWYQEQRDKSNLDYERDLVEANKNRYSLHDMIIMSDILRESKGVLLSMKRNELKSLLEDVRAKSLNNTILSDEVEMLRKYGISSKDNNALTAFLRACARDPENAGRLVGLLSDVLKSGSISLTDFFKNFYNEVGNLK